MFYLLPIIAAVGFGSGYYSASLHYTSELAEYRTKINIQNDEATSLYNKLQEKAHEDEQKQLQIATELDKANESNLATINSYHDQLVNLRLSRKSAGGSSCRNSKTDHNQTEVSSKLSPDVKEGQRELPTTFAGFLEAESLRADRVKLGLESCLDFVLNSNCGLPK